VFLDFALDPDSIYGIIPIWADDILYNIPILVWLNVAYMVLLYWAELAKSKINHQIGGLSKLRPALFTLVVISVVTIVPTGLWRVMKPSSFSITVYNGVIALELIVCNVLSFSYGIKLMRIAKRGWVSSQSDVFKVFLKRLTIFLLSVNFFIILIILGLVAYVSIQITAWRYISLTWIIRTLEVLAVGSAVLMFSSKKPRDDLKSGSSVEIQDITITSSKYDSPTSGTY